MNLHKIFDDIHADHPEEIEDTALEYATTGWASTIRFPEQSIYDTNMECYLGMDPCTDEEDEKIVKTIVKRNLEKYASEIMLIAESIEV